MNERELFNPYFCEYKNKSTCWELVGKGNSDSGSMQMSFDVSCYCMAQRLFLERFNGDAEGLLAALKLFRFPAIHPAFKDRADRIDPDDWLGIYLRHLRDIRYLFDTDIEMKKMFINWLLIVSQDVRDWATGLKDFFMSDYADEFRMKLDAFVKGCCIGVVTLEELMTDYREDGFTPGTSCHDSFEKMLKQIWQ